MIFRRPRARAAQTPQPYHLRALRQLAACLAALSPLFAPHLVAQTFTHPGGLHTLADLDRMKVKVATSETPWIEGWNRLVADSQAQKSYAASPRADFGANRQRASADAHAAYLNAVRWYVSGDTGHADTAVAICNAWSLAVNQIPTGDSLVAIPVFDFAMAGELLRAYPGWAPADFARFQDMMRVYLYPRCHDFLTTHNGACISNSWSNWDICNYGALIAMGVLLDDQAIFEEGVEYFKTGAGTGSIFNAIPYLHPGGLGQWQESGRDQEHAQLAVGMMAAACQIAWNQGVDLFAYADNRLLAGAEYVARTNLSHPVPYTYYTNCQNANQSWVSINGLGRLDDRPVWELVYNHYVVRRGLSAPHVAAIAALMRPEHGSADHFGYGTLTFTLDATASPHPPLAIPDAPTGLRATAGVGRVILDWDASAANAAQGYRVQRATSAAGPFTTLAAWSENTVPRYIDTTVANGIAYHYRVAALNQSGTGANTALVSATPVVGASLPSGWTNQNVGVVAAAGSASYAGVVDGTFVVNATGGGIGGTADAGYNYTCSNVTGDFTFSARLSDIEWNGGSGRIGLMMRETLAANSKTVVLTLGDTGNRQARAGFRATTGGNLNNYGGNDYTWTPAWFRLARTGNTFTAYESSDGATWFAIRSATVSMASTYYVGFLSVTGGTIATATFDNVFSGIPAGLVATPGKGFVQLDWHAPATGAAGYVVKRALAAGGPYVALASGVSETHYTDAAVSGAAIHYYVVSALAASGAEGLDSAEVGAAPLGLRARLRFDDSPVDSAGDAAAVVSGAPAYAAGRVGRALAFDGVDDLATLPAGALPAVAYPELTLAAWVYWDGGAQWQRILDFGTGTSAYLFLTPRSGNNTLRFAIKNGGAEQQLNTTQLATGQWTHLAVTLGGGIGRLYVNGVLAATNTAMSIRPADVAPTANYLGDSQFTADPLFKGRLDDFRLYNFALSASEIAALANPLAAPSNLVATGGDRQATLSWNAPNGADSYFVKRSATSGGPYATIASAVASPVLVDANLVNTHIYYYVVSAANFADESPDSAEVSVTPLDALQRWKVSHGFSATIDDTATPDGDGVPLLLKYAAGLAPGSPAVSPLAVAADDDALELTFPRISPAPVTYVVESSSDLFVWSPIARLDAASDTWTGHADVTETGATATRQTTVRDTVALSTEPRRFLRLELTAP